MIIQVHDELVFEAIAEEADEVEVLVREKMETALTLDIPAVVDIDRGLNRDEAH